jgi:hypothetical protein
MAFRHAAQVLDVRLGLQEGLPVQADGLHVAQVVELLIGHPEQGVLRLCRTAHDVQEQR